jgi:hypothetical protein
MKLFKIPKIIFRNLVFSVGLLALTPLAYSQAKNEVQEQAEVRWKKIEEAEKYTLEIYKDAEGKERILVNETTGPSFTWKEAPKGTFYFRISYKDKNGRQSPFSEVSKLIIDEFESENLKVTLQYPNNKYISPTERQAFEWDNFQDAESYKIVVRKYKKDDIVVENKVNSLSAIVPLSPGLYDWKVIAYDENDQELGSSEIRALKILDPKKAISIDSLNNQRNPNYIKLASYFGNMNVASDLENSGGVVKSENDIQMFPGTYSLDLGQNVSRNDFVTANLFYKNGQNVNINYNEFDLASNWNRYAFIHPSWTFFGGPGLNFSSVSFLSNNSTENIGGSLNYFALTLQGTLIGSFQNDESIKHIINVKTGYALLSTKSTSYEFNYEFRKNKIWLLKKWNYIYQKLFFQIGLGYYSNRISSAGNAINTQEIRLPIGLGYYHSW